MGFDELSGPGIEGASIECSLDNEQKRFAIENVTETEAGVRLTLTDEETGHQWTLAQRNPATYQLETAVEKRTEQLTASDITIR